MNNSDYASAIKLHEDTAGFDEYLVPTLTEDLYDGIKRITIIRIYEYPTYGVVLNDVVFEALSTLEKVDVDCKNRLYRTVETTNYSEKYLQGRTFMHEIRLVWMNLKNTGAIEKSCQYFKKHSNKRKT
jgi:hypothetical protein